LLRSSKRPDNKRSKAAKTDDRFCAQGHLSMDAWMVSVSHLGLLASPLSPAAAQALRTISQPARHGRRDKTLLDKRVRDTGELPADTLALRWAEGACNALQAEVATALGLQQLEARLHNLLVYGPGQFFKPQQDTEKHPGMVATLVLVWPCPHIGGELVVRHGSEQAHFASQHLNADSIRWSAFHADCRHEVLPVAEGWRVVLSFDLELPAQKATPSAAPPPALRAALREHFFPAASPALPPWVFLLDHEYTERGLHWPLLKGTDRLRVLALALRNAAETLGLTAPLALAEVHEHWTAIPGGDGGRLRGRGYGQYGQDGDDWTDDSNAQPDELIERGIVLNHWVAADDQQLHHEALPVADTDTSRFSDTDESFLVNQEYEGDMGNHGHTLEYWYRRAALVLPTPAAEQAGRFISDFDAALADARALARLSAHRGDAWTADLINAWTQPADDWRRPGWRLNDSLGADAAALPSWPQPLAPFSTAGLAAKLSQGLIDQLLRRCQQALVAADRALAGLTPVRRLASLAAWQQALCNLAAALRPSSNVGESMGLLVGHVLAHPLLYPLTALQPLVLVMVADRGANVSPNFDPLIQP
jgi:hypothetical protein